MSNKNINKTAYRCGQRFLLPVMIKATASSASRLAVIAKEALEKAGQTNPIPESASE
jgi:hypothetical protein